jgi:hypothetical protein
MLPHQLSFWLQLQQPSVVLHLLSFFVPLPLLPVSSSPPRPFSIEVHIVELLFPLLSFSSSHQQAFLVLLPFSSSHQPTFLNFFFFSFSLEIFLFFSPSLFLCLFSLIFFFNFYFFLVSLICFLFLLMFLSF